MTKDDDILFNFKSCFNSLLINAEVNFKNGNEASLLRSLRFFVQKNINENLSNRTLQILQSERRKGNEHFLRIFRGELEGIQKKFEKIKSENRGNFLLNELSIAMIGFTDVSSLLNDSLEKYSVEINKSKNDFRYQDNKHSATGLSDLITHMKSDEIVENIKVKYKNIKGKRLKLLLMALQDLELLPKERIAKKFHECCKTQFNWQIASYVAMNDYKYNENTDSEDFDGMREHLKSIIKSN